MALTPAVADLVALYKRTARQGDRPTTDHVRDIMWIGHAIDFLSEPEIGTYYREIRNYRDALHRAEHDIEWS